MIYKFRIILDAEEDVFRDIEMEDHNAFEDFHRMIMKSFGFKGNEMASFFISNEEWDQGEEIPLFNMNEDSPADRIMGKTALKDVMHTENDRLIYVYDFLNLWTFYVTLVKIGEKEPEKTYPNLLYAHGNMPETAVQKRFEGEPFSDSGDDTDNGLDVHNYDDFDFDENWN